MIFTSWFNMLVTSRPCFHLLLPGQFIPFVSPVLVSRASVKETLVLIGRTRILCREAKLSRGTGSSIPLAKLAKAVEWQGLMVVPSSTPRWSRFWFKKIKDFFYLMKNHDSSAQ